MKKLFPVALLFGAFLFAEPVKTQPKEPHNHLLFIEGYERIEKDSLYYALIGWISPNYISSSEAWIIEGEGRLGYTLGLQPKTTMTFFLGGGYLNDLKRSHRHIRSYLRRLEEHTLEYAFGSYGFYLSHMFKSYFGLGLSAKGMIGKGTIGSRVHNNQWANGIDTGLPFTFRFGPKKQYDLVFEPFYIFLKSSTDQSNYLGNRLTIGLRY